MQRVDKGQNIFSPTTKNEQGPLVPQDDNGEGA
jgi:hypothetical protein